MGKDFEIKKEVELPASPEQVWEAIATGPGLSSWLFPFTVEPREGGEFRLDLRNFTEVSTITSWDPPHRLAVRGAEGEDGTVMAYEYLIEGRDGDTTVLRFIHSGHLGEGWGDEYLEMTSPGWDQYFYTLGQYFLHFPGRTATYVIAEGPNGQQDVWQRTAAALGVPADAAVGDSVRLAPNGDECVVDYRTPPMEMFLFGVRGNDAFYRFYGKGDSLDVAVHLFGDKDPKQEEAAWQDFLTRTFSQES